jgi:hypothetical protein
MGAEIEAAHHIGASPPRKVVLSEEAISFLNQMIHSWYEKEVEIVTIDCDKKSREALGTTQEVYYKTPFRPVTGLQVIVSPTVQWSMVRREQLILEEKAQWGGMNRFTVIKEAHKLLVKEIVTPRELVRSTSRSCRLWLTGGGRRERKK